MIRFHPPLMLCGLLVAANAWAQSPPKVPQAQIPPSVLAEMSRLENDFELALSQDCASERCFPKGCVYGEHAVADQPEQSSLPGLGQEEGPGAKPAQEYLTLARCAFAHEKNLRTRDVQALIKRLQSKLSKGWLRVEVTRQVLQPVPKFLREAPEEKPPEPEPVVEPEITEPEPPEEWAWEVAVRELWTTLLPHFFWMIAVIMGTIAALILTWGWRRVGRESAAEQALLAQLSEPEALPEAEEPEDAVVEEIEPLQLAEGENPETAREAFVAEQRAMWQDRLNSFEPGDTDLRDLVRQWLRLGEIDLLAKAIMLFPEAFLQAFPSGGELAATKLELADYLKAANPEQLPSDAEFFETLNQHALSSSVASQADAEVVRALREEFGPVGIARLAEQLPPRHAALLFALAPVEFQREIARILPAEQATQAVQQLLASDRMDPDQTAQLFDVLDAVRSGSALPELPTAVEVTDRGPQFDAATGLSVLLPFVPQEQRALLFKDALERFSGAFPSWYQGILYPEMLLRLAPEAQADVFLAADVNALSAWIGSQENETRATLEAALPASLRAAVGAAAVSTPSAKQNLLAAKGRRELAAALHEQLSHNRLSLEDVVL